MSVTTSSADLRRTAPLAIILLCLLQLAGAPSSAINCPTYKANPTTYGGHAGDSCDDSEGDYFYYPIWYGWHPQISELDGYDICGSGSYHSQVPNSADRDYSLDGAKQRVARYATCMGQTAVSMLSDHNVTSGGRSVINDLEVRIPYPPSESTDNNWRGGIIFPTTYASDMDCTHVSCNTNKSDAAYGPLCVGTGQISVSSVGISANLGSIVAYIRTNYASARYFSYHKSAFDYFIVCNAFAQDVEWQDRDWRMYMVASLFAPPSPPPPSPPSPFSPPSPPPLSCGSSTAWRIHAHAGTASGWAWDVKQLHFFDGDDGRLVPSAAIESGSVHGSVSASYGANGCIFGANLCGLRNNTSDDDLIWVGAEWGSAVPVRALSFVQPSGAQPQPHRADKVSVDCRVGSIWVSAVLEHAANDSTTEPTVIRWADPPGWSAPSPPPPSPPPAQTIWLETFNSSAGWGEHWGSLGSVGIDANAPSGTASQDPEPPALKHVRAAGGYHGGSHYDTGTSSYLAPFIHTCACTVRMPRHPMLCSVYVYASQVPSWRKEGAMSLPHGTMAR